MTNEPSAAPAPLDTALPTAASEPSPAANEGVNERTIAEAQKLFGLDFDETERVAIAADAEKRAQGWRNRRATPLPNQLAPAVVFNPVLPGHPLPARVDRFVRSPGTAAASSTDDDLAFAPVSVLSRMLQSGGVTSTRLTELSLARLEQFDPQLECVITLCKERALVQAARADEEIAAGRYRGPLHGVPWGAKDLFDTAGIRTTWGAATFRDRVAETDATVVAKLDAAGAVLVAKLSLGALAYGDIWFGGKTKNPFQPQQGSSGSSAGSAAAVAAGLVPFALGTETLGSIVSPCMRCGVTGLRPTFGRVSRAGAMALCWSLDKVGPICRTVEDTALVLDVIRGSDPADAASVDQPFAFDAVASLEGLRVGYAPKQFGGRSAVELDRAALRVLQDSAAEMVEIRIPDAPYERLHTILFTEAAAAFEELTLTNRDDELTWQDAQAWPNSFRKAWFTPAIELVQAQRIRRQVQEQFAALFEQVDVIVGPSYGGPMLVATNHTGHPSLTLRIGFRSRNRPHGITLWGRLFDEGTLCRVGMEIERALDVWHIRPDLG